MTGVRRGILSELFTGAAAKALSAVEASPQRSNQHELNGASPLRRIFGTEDRRSVPTRFIWLGDEQEAISAEGSISWYDARRQHPTRSEYRLYYTTNPVTDLMQAGDHLFVALRNNGTAMVVVAPAATAVRNQLLWLFELKATEDFSVSDICDLGGKIDFAARYILDELGIDIEEPETGRLDELLQPIGLEFPTTRVFSELARTSLPHIDPRDDADSVLMAWVEQEERLFRRLERRIVASRLLSGFAAEGQADVDGFIAFSLSVQNRRKARAGRSLENHLEALFISRKLRFQRGAETENRNSPDFLFPGQTEYRDPQFPVDGLTMLGAKSTLKDRWRQVLAEANRIPAKHLITLQPGISENQTDQMRAASLQLVVPRSIHETFQLDQAAWLISVADFVELLQQRQRHYSQR